MQDPRTKNRNFDASFPFKYLTEYSLELQRALQTVDPEALNKAIELLKSCSKSDGTVLVGGNGGSAAISDHLCCDWTKGTYRQNNFRLKTHSLVANTALFSAISNDFGYSQSLAYQIELLSSGKDVALLISSSGNSENIIAAARMAKSRGIPVIGLSGFEGGLLKAEADISLYVAAHNYGIVEDAHQSLMHIIAQYIDIHNNR